MSNPKQVYEYTIPEKSEKEIVDMFYAIKKHGTVPPPGYDDDDVGGAVTLSIMVLVAQEVIDELLDAYEQSGLTDNERRVCTVAMATAILGFRLHDRQIVLDVDEYMVSSGLDDKVGDILVQKLDIESVKRSFGGLRTPEPEPLITLSVRCCTPLHQSCCEEEQLS